MKLLAKLAVSFFMAITLISTVMLRVTSEVYLQSQSAYANQPNVIWYILIHLGMILSFFTLNATSKKRFAYGATALASIIVVALDMYGFSSLHNIATAFLFGLASYCLAFYSHLKLKKAYLYVCLALGVAFGAEVAFSETLPYNIYDIESVIEWSFAIMLTINSYFFKKSS